MEYNSIILGDFGDLLFLEGINMLTNIAIPAAVTGDIPNWFAVTMGIGTVFVGLLSIIIICVLTGALCGASKRREQTVNPTLAQNKSVKKTDENRAEILAAVCAACAEDMGTDVNTLKVVSFKKL